MEIELNYNALGGDQRPVVDVITGSTRVVIIKEGGKLFWVGDRGYRWPYTIGHDNLNRAMGPYGLLGGSIRSVSHYMQDGKQVLYIHSTRRDVKLFWPEEAELGVDEFVRSGSA